MSFNRKNVDNNSMQTNDNAFSELNKDDLNIKTHLNTSLELRGITVSEDLINRTLQAVKQSEEVISNSEDKDLINSDNQKDNKLATRKLVPWNKYIRIAAGTAAAVLVVVAGLNFQNGFGKKSMQKMDTATPITDESTNSSEPDTKDDSTKDSADNAKAEAGSSQEDTQADTMLDRGTETSKSSSDQKQNKVADTKSKTDVSEDTGKNTSTGNASKESSDDNSNKDDKAYTGRLEADSSDNSKSSDKLLEENKTVAAKGNGGQKDVDDLADKSALTASQDTASLVKKSYLSFMEIALAAPEAVQSITIMDETNQTKIIIKDEETIKSFYTVMDQQQFTKGLEPSSSINYTIEVKSIQTQQELYTMKVGDSVTVSCIDGNTVYENIYNALDETQLINNLEAFYRKNSN